MWGDSDADDDDYADAVIHARNLTQMLRSDPRPYWTRVRELFRSRGVSPEEAVIADTFPDDVDFVFGVVISQNRRVFQFDFEHYEKDVEDGNFTAWRDVTDSYLDKTYALEVQAGLEMLAEQADI